MEQGRYVGFGPNRSPVGNENEMLMHRPCVWR